MFRASCAPLLALAGGALLRNHSASRASSAGENNNPSKSSLDDCLNPACHSTMDLLKQFNMRKKNPSSSSLSTEQKALAMKNNDKTHIDNPYQSGCPADRDQLGNGTWDLIHTIAATYPEEPSEEQKQHVDNFLRSLSVLYPCPYCATHFQECIVKSPPSVQSREALMLWCCDFHNKVNVKLGKPQFTCSVAELDLRWKDGRDECWENKGVEK